jgi:hypothetical protein
MRLTTLTLPKILQKMTLAMPKVTPSNPSSTDENQRFREGNTTDLGGYAAEMEMAVEYHKDGKYQGCIGTKLI